MLKQDIVSKIRKIKKERNAIILSHYYSLPEIQENADFLGDSLELSRKAGSSEADIIVFCGVHFMAETASIIAPDKKVLLPVSEAGCSLADGITGDDLAKWKENNPDGVVVTYVNTTAMVKAYSDYCCTSSNALRVVQAIPKDKNILFAPDANLGAYISKTTGRKMEIWDGACHVHNNIDIHSVLYNMNKYPEADILIHPESYCSADPIVLKSDRCFLYSTSGIIKHVVASKKKQFVIATEEGILHKLQKECPDKEFIMVRKQVVCTHMKNARLEDVLLALEHERFQVKVPKEIRDKAIVPIDRMLEIG